MVVNLGESRPVPGRAGMRSGDRPVRYWVLKVQAGKCVCPY